MNRTLVLAVAGIAALAITAASIFAVTGVSRRQARISRADKAGIIYDRATELLDSRQKQKAIRSYDHVVEKYSGSPYALKSLRALCEIYEKSGQEQKARQYYSRILTEFPDIPDKEKIRARVEQLGKESSGFPVSTEGLTEYTVRSGDSLYVIARRFNTTVALIKKLNNLSSDVIRVGQRLNIDTGKFSIYVDKSANTLTLNRDGVAVKTYTVSTGTDNSTPVGLFKITDKVIGAPWTRPDGKVILPGDPEYELGARWMAINVPGYGIHGTNDETTIGGQVTAGCVRMYNDDVIELYDTVTPGTEVEIVD